MSLLYNSTRVTVSAMKASVGRAVTSVLRGTLAIRTVSRVLAVPSAAPMMTSVFSASVK